MSFNGGTTAQLTPQEQAAAHDHHVTATASQTQHEHTASTNRALLASENHGRPAIAATSKPGEFAGKGVVAAREAKPRPVTLGAAAAGVKPLETKPLDNRALGNKRAAGNARAATNNGANGVPPKPPQAGVKSPPAGAKPVAAAPKPYPPAKPAPRVAAVAQHPALHQTPPPAAKPKAPPPHKPEHWSVIGLFRIDGHSQIGSILIQDAGWSGGQDRWPEPIHWICGNVLWRRWQPERAAVGRPTSA